MYPTLLDVKTGKKVTDEKWDSSLFWWSLGNGSCDCNRAIIMGDEVDDEMEAQFEPNECFGCQRIIAVDVHGDLNGMDKAAVLAEINRGYPSYLVNKHACPVMP